MRSDLEDGSIARSCSEAATVVAIDVQRGRSGETQRWAVVGSRPVTRQLSEVSKAERHGRMPGRNGGEGDGIFPVKFAVMQGNRVLEAGPVIGRENRSAEEIRKREKREVDPQMTQRNAEETRKREKRGVDPQMTQRNAEEIRKRKERELIRRGAKRRLAEIGDRSGGRGVREGLGD